MGSSLQDLGGGGGWLEVLSGSVVIIIVSLNYWMSGFVLIKAYLNPQSKMISFSKCTTLCDLHLDCPRAA